MTDLPYTIARFEDVSFDERIAAQMDGNPWHKYRFDANGDLWLRRWDTPAIHAEHADDVPVLRGVPTYSRFAAEMDDDQDDETEAGDELLDAMMNRLIQLEGRVAALEQAEPQEETADE